MHCEKCVLMYCVMLCGATLTHEQHRLLPHQDLLLKSKQLHTAVHNRHSPMNSTGFCRKHKSHNPAWHTHP